MISKLVVFFVGLGVRFLLGFSQVVVRFVLRNLYGSKRNQLPPITDKILLESASSLAAKIRTRQLKSEDVVRAYVTRIQQVEPYINAVVDDRFVDAIEEAKKVDSYLQSNNVTEQELLGEKPFLGVPFTTKNGIGVKGLAMDAGVSVVKGSIAQEDSEVVALMRKAGAIPLCVSNVPELLLWFDASNKIYGRSNNPYDLTRIPGGSSGGEGGLIASAASTIGIGNDIGGSIRFPSFCSGIFGHKPTRKIISNKGQFPSSYQNELDNYNVSGPMCRYADDLLPMMKVLLGEHANKLKIESKVDLKKLKVFYCEEYINDVLTSQVSEEMKDAVRKVVSHLEKSFGITAQKVEFPEMRLGFLTWIMKLSTEYGLSHIDEMISKKKKKISLPLEFLKWFFRLSKHTLHTLFIIVLMRYSPTQISSGAALRKRLNNDFDKLQQDIQTTLGSNGVLIFPPYVEPAIYHQEHIFKFFNHVYTAIFSILGFPVTQCPTGLSKEGLPLGVQVVGNYNQDHRTIAVAREIEKFFGGWKTPSAII